MPPRKCRTTAKSPPTPPVPSRVVQPSSVAPYNGPVTPHSLVDAPIKRHSIDSLPFEVLSTIFILTLASDEDIIKQQSLVGSMDPFPLCAVSSLWRTLALATPKLWSRVFVDVPYDISKAMTHRSKPQLVPCIKRSGSLPLTLFIRYCNIPYRNRSGIRNSVVNVLNRYASRWDALYVECANEIVKPHGNPLELVRIDKWSSLQRVYGAKPLHTITFAQLTHLKSCRHSELSYAQVVDIFKRCPRLVWLSLSIDVAPQFINAPASPTTLHDLSFASFSANNLSTIYQLVSLPSLRELLCRQIHQFTEAGSFRSLLSLLTRSACTLDKLEIRGMPSFSGDLVQLLTHRSCSFLTSLGICPYMPCVDVLVNDEVLRTLTLHHDNSACTHLKFLTLYCRTRECSESALRKMVESRSQPQDGLLYLEIENFGASLASRQRLDEVIKRSEMVCESQRDDFRPRRLRLRRRGFRGNVPTRHES